MEPDSRTVYSSRRLRAASKNQPREVAVGEESDRCAIGTRFSRQPSARREFIKAVGALSAFGIAGADLRQAVAADPPPETTKIRLVQNLAICLAPQYLSEELLRLEGFTQIEYISQTGDDPNPSALLNTGRADITMDGATAVVPALDAGRPLVILSGVHGGCYQLLGNERVRAIRDLKGKRI